MRGRPGPSLSLALTLWLLVPVAIGGAADGSMSPIAPDPGLDQTDGPQVVPSHHPLSQTTRTDTSPYIDLVFAFRPGDDGAAKGDPTRALGIPGSPSVGLGEDGCIILVFTDLHIRNAPLDHRANLRIYEAMDGYD